MPTVFLEVGFLFFKIQSNFNIKNCFAFTITNSTLNTVIPHLTRNAVRTVEAGLKSATTNEIAEQVLQLR